MRKIDRIPNGSGIFRPGQDLAVAGSIGKAGAALALKTRKAEIAARFSEDFIDQIRKKTEERLNLTPEILTALGATEWETADEGGIFAALWNLSGGYGQGISLDPRRIPADQEIIEICELFDHLTDRADDSTEQQSGQAQQQEADAADVPVDGIHQLLPVDHVLDQCFLPQLFLQPRDAVRMDVGRLEPDFQRGPQRIEAREPPRVGARLAHVVLQRLLLRDIGHLLHERLLLQRALQIQDVALVRPIVQHQGEVDILAHIDRQVAGCQHGKQRHAQQQQDQHRADGGRHRLHVEL